MCTSFINRKNNLLTAMNFDNNGMPFNIVKNSKHFIVYVDGGRGKHPSFDVNSNGTFINNLFVSSNGKGLYKRAGKKVTHTSKLVSDILSASILPCDINSYLENIEVVNVPDFSTHNMIVEKSGNVWIVEPGRGVIHNSADEAPYFIMTNFSLCDMMEKKELNDDGMLRYKTAKTLLDKKNNLDVNSAFQILDAVKQSEGNWTTVLSMVYSQKENAVYYCFERDFENILKHSFE